MPFYTQLGQPEPPGSEREETRKRTIDGLKRLRLALQDHFPDDTDRMRTLRIGTWNIREFGGTSYGGRDSYEPLYYMAEILSNFDIAALQEVRGDLKEFHQLLKILGPDWDFIATDVTGGGAGNGERMVFAFNRTRVRFRNIAGELTLPDGQKVLADIGERVRLDGGLTLELPEGHAGLSGRYRANSAKQDDGTIALKWDLDIPLPAGSLLRLPEGAMLSVTRGTEVTRPPGTRGTVDVQLPEGPLAGENLRLRLPEGTLDDSHRQFARTPFIVSFQAGWLKIDLATVHILYGDASETRLLAQRRREIARLTEALGKRAASDMRANLGNPVLTAVLGDFNILSAEHETMQALQSNGFEVPEALQSIPGSNVRQDKAYDQIAFWDPRADRGYVHFEARGAGVFDFFQHVYRSGDEALYRPQMRKASWSYAAWRTYKMSDHLPMWIELKSDFADAYLEACDAAELPPGD